MRCAGYSAFLEFEKKEKEKSGLHVDIRVVRPVDIDQFEDVFGNIIVIKLGFSGLDKEAQEKLLKMDLDENLLGVEFQLSPSMAITSGITLGMKKTDVKKMYMINIFTRIETIKGSKREKTDTVIIDEKTYKRLMRTLKMLDAKETFETIRNIIEEKVPINWSKFWENAKCSKIAKKKLTIRMDPEVIEKLKIAAAKTGKTISQLIEETAKQIIKENT